MSSFSPMTEADLSRARTDPAFRQKLLQQSLDALLDRLQKERQLPSSVAAKPGQMREGVTLRCGRRSSFKPRRQPRNVDPLAFPGRARISPAFRSTPAGG